MLGLQSYVHYHQQTILKQIIDWDQPYSEQQLHHHMLHMYIFLSTQTNQEGKCFISLNSIQLYPSYYQYKSTNLIIFQFQLPNHFHLPFSTKINQTITLMFVIYRFIMASNKGQRIVTWEQLEKHTLPSDCWVVVDQIVYNATDFLVEHPGGDQILVRWSGLDATPAFSKVGHSQYALSLRNAREVGRIESPQYPQGYQKRLLDRKDEQNKKKKRKVIIEPIDPEIVKRHNSEEDCWIIVRGKVYDVTYYLNTHPGGIGKMMQYAGRDATNAFQEQGHSLDALKTRQEYYIGQVQKKSSSWIIILGLLVVIVGVLLTQLM